MNPDVNAAQNSRILDGIEKCLYCCIECGRAFQARTRPQGAELPEALQLSLVECAEICRTTASFLRWDSAYWEAACALCADICMKCAWECARVSEDEQIRIARDACEQCAVLCRELAGRREPFSRVRMATDVARRSERAMLAAL